MEGKMDLLTVVCLFSMEWDCGAAEDIWSKASRGTDNINIFMESEIILLKNKILFMTKKNTHTQKLQSGIYDRCIGNIRECSSITSASFP